MRHTQVERKDAGRLLLSFQISRFFSPWFDFSLFQETLVYKILFGFPPSSIRS